MSKSKCIAPYLEKTMKSTIPLMPLRDIVVFPNVTIPLLVGREKSVKALQEALSRDSLLLLCTQKRYQIEEPSESELYNVGTLSEIVEHLKLPDGSYKILVEGRFRILIRRFHQCKDFLCGQGEIIRPPEIEQTVEIDGLTRVVTNQFEEYIRLNPKVPDDLTEELDQVRNLNVFLDYVCANLVIPISEKQQLLELLEPVERLKQLCRILTKEVEILRIEKKIMMDVKKEVEQAQKEFYLQEQLKVIERELGRKEGPSSVIGNLKNKILKAKMSKEAEETALLELEKLERTPSISQEATVIRNYIDWLVSLPWFERTKDNIDIENVEKILNEDHYGLKRPKQRILEYLAVKKLSGFTKGPILCFVGPPGVGKTSLAKSIARALGRRFIRVSLGGIRDEAEIRGHRRTYVGALPGRIIQSMRKSGTRNPVFLLDEIDKMSVDFRGDPSSALLEVLDPEQNHSFSDHYLEVGFDLSDCFFITTANIVDNIPYALRDRMEVVRLPGYTEHEKLNIATRFLIPKEVNSNGLHPRHISFTQTAVTKIIRNYTREAGVRDLQRRISQISRKVAREVVRDSNYKISIIPSNLVDFLGPAQYTDFKKGKYDEVGVATGLAWTEFGGDVMSVESSLMRGKGRLILTGKLGEVMRESAQAALSYIKSEEKNLGIKQDGLYNNIDVHIHVPEGAIPKDGPSAGITMAVALVSAFTKRPVRSDVAMTGEITLRGRVLGVGGLKSKLLAAHRAGIKTVIIPEENKKDLYEIPKEIRKSLELVLVRNMEQVLKIALKGRNNKGHRLISNSLKKGDSQDVRYR